jgi:hypothetical protein
MAAIVTIGCAVLLQPEAQAQQSGADKKPNILVIFGDDIGQSDISAYTFGLIGFKTALPTKV